VLLLVFAAFGVSGCSKDKCPAGPSTPAFRGEISDTRGDAETFQGASSVPPDLVRAVVEVTGGSVMLTATLAEGTLTRARWPLLRSRSAPARWRRRFRSVSSRMTTGS
jgi:hypothetical protein